MKARIRLGVLAVLTVTSAALFGAPAASGSEVATSFRELTVSGDNDADVIAISTDGTTITYTDTGAGGASTSDADCTQVNPTTVTCPAVSMDGPVDRIFAFLGNGVDSFTNQNLVTDFASIGGFGTGSKTINGGPGSQSLFGGLDSDVLNGGEGNDTLNDGSAEGEGVAPAGNDVLSGGPGQDTATYFREPPVALTISLDGVANDGQAGEADNVDTEDVSTSDGNDTLIGDRGPNLLGGGGGDDVIRGGGGNDTLLGDFGAFGGLILVRGIPTTASGSDTLDGGAGRDGLDCGPSIDVALVRPEDDVETTCERIGALVMGDSSPVSGKKKKSFKVNLKCPAEEGQACKGKLVVTSGGKKIGKGKFSVKDGKTKGAKAKLSKKGAKALRKAGGSLLVTVTAKTKEPGGTAESTDRVLVHR